MPQSRHQLGHNNCRTHQIRAGYSHFLKSANYFFKTDIRRAQQLLRWEAVWPQQTWAEKWGRLLCPFPWKELSPHLTQCHVAWAKANLRTKWHFDPSNRLATIHQRYRQTRRRCRSIGRTVTCHGCSIKPVHVAVIRRYAMWLKVTPVYAIIHLPTGDKAMADLSTYSIAVL